MRQAIQISREAFCWASGATELALMTRNLSFENARPTNISVEGIQFYNTVVLVGR
jgi:hypothetical protein